MSPPTPLILTHTAVASLLTSLPASTIHNIIASLTASLQTLAQPTVITQPPRQTLRNNVAAANYTTLVMPCSTPNLTSVKSVTLPTPPTPPSPPNGVITLQDAAGRLLAVLNAEEITAFRTACVSIALLLERIGYGVAVKRAVVFGTGKQAEWISRLLLKLCPTLRRLAIIGREGNSPGKMEAFVDKFRSGVESETKVGWKTYGGGIDREVQNDLREADAIFCCTPSTVELFPVEFLTDEKGRYISLIGSYKPHMKELSPGYLRRDSVTAVVDSIEACLVEAGEVTQAGLKGEDLTDIGSVVSDFSNGFGEKYLGDVVFKCVGLAIMDLVAAEEIVKIARERKVGVEVLGFSA
ncbi:NAD(P)-binding protein [Tuber magnatum]|uniref:NAD(P)-binding protein n=1 Tax=Tuber magnatum TaxID=42249 RepID=A0A317SRZ0_9PEZI|nr:NAD(P)-binding protein [Tuber magnatum]